MSAEDQTSSDFNNLMSVLFLELLPELKIRTQLFIYFYF